MCNSNSATMVITSSKEYSYMVIVMMLALVMFYYILLYLGCGWLIGVVLIAFPMLITVRYWIALRRTITISEKGCTVKFLWYIKSYEWKELRVAKIKQNAHTFGYKEYGVEGVVFLPIHIRKPKWIKPATYCVFAHPLSVFFVYFNSVKQNNQYIPDMYAVEEECFLNKMSMWNIVIEQ